MLAEYRSLRTGCGLSRRSPRLLLELSGEDRGRFLQSLITCDVQALEPGQGFYGFFTDAKGHILSDAVARAFEDRFWLELPESTADPIASHLEKHVVTDRVEIDRVERVALTLAGTESGRLVAGLLGEPPPAAGSWTHRTAIVLGHPVVLSTDRRVGVPALKLWVQQSSVEELTAALLALEAPVGPREVGPESMETVRVEEGVALFGQDFGPDNLPQETAIEEAVSYTKGCYLGQEVIARLHYRGQVSRQLRALRFEGPDQPAPGTMLLLDDREAGKVTSSARSPETGRLCGLAMLGRRAFEAGTELLCAGGGTATVG